MYNLEFMNQMFQKMNCNTVNGNLTACSEYMERLMLVFYVCIFAMYTV